MKRHLLVPALIILPLAGCGTDVTSPSATFLSCTFGEPTRPGVGDVLHVSGEEHWDVCLSGDVSAEYVYVPFYATEDTLGELPLALTGAGIGGVQAEGSSGLQAAEPLFSVRQRPGSLRDFHGRLRLREIRELEPRIRAAPATAVAMDDGSAPAADAPVVGELRDFNVSTTCSGTQVNTGRVVYVSDHAVLYEDTANVATLTAADYEYFGATFDTLVYPVETTHFGAPTDIDQNDRSILFFTRAVNERNDRDPNSPPGSSPITIGFFWSGDLFPTTETDRLQACPASNESEMFYLISPDPNGVIGNAPAISIDQVRNQAIPLIGHEFQHLINASRRLFVNNATTFESPWLNEGLSHAAEELLYLEASGLRTGTNITVQDILESNAPANENFGRYMASNILNFAKYLSRPDTASLMGPPNSLATRGAAWHFLRYAADRSGTSDTTFFFNVVNGTDKGVQNLNGVTGGQTLDWMRDWSVAVYADDEVDTAPRYGVDTWNLRDIYPALEIQGVPVEVYPLRVLTLVNGRTQSSDLTRGRILFRRFGVAAGERAAIHVDAGSGGPPSTLRGSFVRVR